MVRTSFCFISIPEDFFLYSQPFKIQKTRKKRQTQFAAVFFSLFPTSLKKNKKKKERKRNRVRMRSAKQCPTNKLSILPRHSIFHERDSWQTNTFLEFDKHTVA